MVLSMTSDIPIDGAVLTRARSGDDVAFEQLVRLHERRVLGLALRLSGNLADAQDVAQEVFLRLHRNLAELADSDTVGPWLRRVTVNLCIDLSRRVRAVRSVRIEDLGSELRSSDADSESTYARREKEERLLAALSRLSERERSALVLRELEGLTTAEVALELGIAEATIRVHIANARLKLRTLLKELQ